MKKLFSILIFTGCSAGSFAQISKLADSLYYLQTGEHLKSSKVQYYGNKKPVSQNLYYYQTTLHQLILSQTNATQLIANNTQDAGLLQFLYDYSSGGLHASLIPYQSDKASLYTEGFKQLGKRVKVGGKFLFQKEWDDSLSNNLGAQPNRISPYYYFTPKAGKYESQIYDMSAILSYAVVSEKLFLGLKADYQYDWQTGSVDPRLDEKKLSVKIQPSLTYRIGRTYMGVAYHYGYGDENMDIKYKSKVYSGSMLFPERFYYLNMGYGNIALRYDAVKNRKLNTRGTGVSLATRINDYELKANLVYEQNEERNRQKYDTLKVSDLFSRWQLNSFAADVLITRQQEHQSTQQLGLKVKLNSGSDYNTLYNGQNYSAIQDEFDISYDYLFQGTSGKSYQVGIFSIFNHTRQHDILADHFVRYSTIEPGLNGHVYLETHREDRFHFQIGSSVVFPVTNELTVPSTQVNVFTNGVAWPNYYFYGSTRLNAVGEINFMSPRIVPNLFAGLFLRGVYCKRLSSVHDENIPVQADSGNHRFQMQIGFNLYL